VRSQLNSNFSFSFNFSLSCGSAEANFQAKILEPGLKLLAAASLLDESNEKVQQKIKDTQNVAAVSLVMDLQAEMKVDVENKLKQIEIARWAKLVESKIQAGKIDEVETAFLKCSEDVKQSEELKFLRAKFFYIKGVLKEAILLLEEVLQINCNHSEAKRLLEMATAIDELTEVAARSTTEKKYEESIEILTKVVAVDPTNKQILQAAYFQRSLAHFSLLNTAEAFADFKKTRPTADFSHKETNKKYSD
jgi:tetratricopeptide (TPR) repeat protein